MLIKIGYPNPLHLFSRDGLLMHLKIGNPTFYMLSSSKSSFDAFSFSWCLIRSTIHSLLFVFILQAFTEELNSPLSETQTTKSPWKDPRDVEEKKECPRCFESCRAKIQNYYTSFKSFLAKNDLSYFIEMSSRVFFPLTYMAFIAYFFGKYGI